MKVINKEVSYFVFMSNKNLKAKKGSLQKYIYTWNYWVEEIN